MPNRRARAALGLLVACLIATTLALTAAQSPAARTYFPARGEWRKQDPGAVGVDKAKLEEAVAFALAHENPETKDLAVAILNQFRAEAPYNTLIGPTQARAGSNGLIIRRGSVIGEWGDTGRADMTFSVTKTFLSTVVGIAFDRGQIKNVTGSCRDVYAPWRRSLYLAAQRSNHLGTPASPDERLVGHLMGQTRLG